MGDSASAHALEPLPLRNPRVAARVINGETMVLTPHNSVLHTLNPVATRIWQLLPEHGTLDSMVEALQAEYEASEAQLQVDVRELMGALLERQILVER